tara:strand:+ start:283 stop:654 length:372 start_codon:yes stop_codon:yes gene_type:complete
MIKNILVLSAIFLLVDSGYLFLMKDKFNKIVKAVQNEGLKLNIIYTLACYVFLISSIFYFIIGKNASLQDAFFLGLFIYGVFETTNLAIFKKWDPIVATVDTIWGGILFTLTTYFYRIFIKKI